MLIGYIFAILCSLFNSLQDGFKKYFVSYLSEYQIVIVIMGVQALFSWFFLLILGPPFSVKKSFWLPWLGTVAINITAQFLYIKALKLAPLSLTVPFITLTPLFLLINGKLILGELPTFQGGVGIFLIIIGSWLLYQTRGKDLLIKNLKRYTLGILFMTTVSLLWSFSSVFDKLAVKASSPLFHASLAQSAISLLLSIYYWLRFKSSPLLFLSIKEVKKRWYLVAGLLGCLALIFQFYSLTYIQVVYTISIKRAGVIISVFIGWLYFKEKGGMSRVFPSILMIIGSVLIILYG